MYVLTAHGIILLYMFAIVKTFLCVLKTLISSQDFPKYIRHELRKENSSFLSFPSNDVLLFI